MRLEHEDLADALQKKHPNLPVTFRSSPSWESDWLYLARAKTLFCSPSSFCLTAAWANPNKVYFATNGRHASVVSDDPTFREQGIVVVFNDDDDNDAIAGFTWVSMDFIPGKTLKKCPRKPF